MGLGTGARARLTARPLPTLLQPLESLAAVKEGRLGIPVAAAKAPPLSRRSLAASDGVRTATRVRMS